MKTKWNWIVILALLLGLVFTGPNQSVSAQELATANFTFTSSASPSNYGQPVTFTLSATGNDPTYPPIGYVEFRDADVTIPGCASMPLNLSGGDPAADVPATCTISSLAVGTHTITALFTTIIQNYANEILTLQGGQTVNDSIPLTIYPSTLMGAMMTVDYQLLLIASFPGGSRCENCTWYTTQGELPNGISLNSASGELQGTPSTPGAYAFTVVAEDGNGARGSRQYSWNITKVKPIVDVGLSVTYVDSTVPTTLGATARHPYMDYLEPPTGKISFSVGGVAVPGCSGTAAISTNAWGQAYCTSYLPTGLAAGDYDVLAEFTPDATSNELYQSGSGIGRLQVDSQPRVQVSGLVFMDNDQDGVRDASEVAQGNWNVFLNQDCDGFLEGNVVTNPNTGEFSFEPVPTDHPYCLFVDLSSYSGYIQTTPFNNLTLSVDKYFEIGVYYPHISILPSSENLPAGRVGTYYKQTFQISGGTQPYTSSVSYPLPAGLTFDAATLTLSGTPTAGGIGELRLHVDDSGGLSAEMTYWLMIQTDGAFTFTSSSNPSAQGNEVTFTVSATGDAVHPNFGPTPPVGFITFSVDGTPIDGCAGMYLNVIFDQDEKPIIGDYPAICTTAALETGTHEITATYTDLTELYSEPFLLLIQQVEAASSLTISPETLPNAAFQTPYSQQLTASGGTMPYAFSLAGGSLPQGITLSKDGLLSGYPDGYLGYMELGTYPITIQIVDTTGATANRGYDFVLDKGTPTVTVFANSPISWNVPITISAEVKMETPYGYYYLLDGTAAFSIDGNPVPDCQAVSYAANYRCENISMNLAVGPHTVTAVYTPAAWNEPYYLSGSGSTELTVQPRNLTIQGQLFDDRNQNGVYDYSEEYTLMEGGWTVNLDQDCDGGVDYTTTTSWGGFVFEGVPVSGQCHRITVIGAPGYQQTTQLEDFIPDKLTFTMVGFYYPTITLSPREYELPSGRLGVAYSQAFTASGGAGPYTYTITEGSLPAGLLLSADGILSGTPTLAGSSQFTVVAEDANQVAGREYYSISIMTDGVFTFTSSSNPSAQGNEVIFTVSATGDAVHPYFGSIPPVGVVTFSVDGTPIEGCSGLYLNLGPDSFPGDYPATCTTAALETGTHEITATYTEWMGSYNDTSLTLTQVVNTAVSADLSITNKDKLDPVKPGAKQVYTLTVRNLGPNSAESVIVTDKLDGNTTYVSVSAPNGWICRYAANSGTVTCSNNNLASGSSSIIKITVIVNKTTKVGKELANNAFVSSTTFDPQLSNNSAVQKTRVAK